MPNKPREEFKDWLARQLAERKMKPYHLTKRMNELGYEIHASTVLSALSGDKEPSAPTLRAMAHALGLPQHTVFLAAGLLTEAPLNLEDHPIKNSILRQIDRQKDEKLLSKILALIEIAADLGGGVEGGEEDPPKRATKTKLPLAQ